MPMFTKCRCSQTQTKELSYLVRSDSDPATCVFSHLGFASWFCALGWQPAMDRGRDEARGGEARQPTRHYQERGGDERRGDDADDRYCYPRRREDHREEEERAISRSLATLATLDQTQQASNGWLCLVCVTRAETRTSHLICLAHGWT